MELRHLRYFLAVAEERHFTRAAERVGIQQPPLSLQIKQLEEELGTPLFVRHSRGVDLTEAGTTFVEEARQLLERVEQAKTHIQRLSRGEAGRIRIGFAGATYFEPAVPALIRDYRARYPDVQLQPQQSNTAELVQALIDGSVDAAFVHTPIGSAPELACLPLVDEAMLLALPANHPLSEEAAVPLSALADDTFILLPRDISPGLYDRLIVAFQQAGFMPKLGLEAPQIVSIVPMVAAGFGVSLVPRAVSQIDTPGVRYLSIAGVAPRAPIGLAYREDAGSAALRQFISLAEAGASTHDAADSPER
ncbi:LysR substrate-binding domain-containing protein [Crenobacter sp. SG2303]|uniref:LysR substrate-binding domain-containing protein n=1 Tax=Crenobacter oryzisoli TaxID=3056844 RepID=A0ABT7XIW7_9NEIS|nr:LysR substrate-binding domain-containing protein [Crenobacter sp. SG2303]MDN0073727.1 LysR substrate-binding domain-containing protein [Crenobacter sp. SG2303]